MSLQNKKTTAVKTTTTKTIKQKEIVTSFTQNTQESTIYIALTVGYVEVKPKLMVQPVAARM